MAAMSLNAARTLPQIQGLSSKQALGFLSNKVQFRSKSISKSRIVMSAGGDSEQNENVRNMVAQITAVGLVASAVLPEVAEAAITPSLKNLLLSVAAGFGVLTAIVVAVLGVATFDPVKRS